MKKHFEFKIIKLNFLACIVMLALLMSSLVIPIAFAETANVDGQEVKLGIIATPKIDITLAKARTTTDVTQFEEKIKQNLKNLNIDTSDTVVNSVQAEQVNMSTSFTWNEDKDPTIGTIDITGNGQNVEMKGNQNTPGKNAIWIIPDGNQEQKFSFNYNIDFGDSFSAAGMLLRVKQKDQNTLTGYMLSFNKSGRSEYYTACGSRLGALWRFTYDMNNLTVMNKNLVEGIDIQPSGNLIVSATDSQIKISGSGLSQEYTYNIPSQDEEIIGNGYGFFSEHYSHGCTSIGSFKLENINLTTTTVQSMSEVLRVVSWRNNAYKFFVFVTDEVSKELEGSSSAELLTRIINENTYFIPWGNDSNQESMQAIVDSCGQGRFVNNTPNGFDNSVQETATYIKEVLDQDLPNDMILLNEPLSLTVTPENIAKNTIDDQWKYGKWKVEHDPTYFEHDLGQYSKAGTYTSDMITSFDKTGKFTMTYKDQPIIPEYILVHRRPTAIMNLHVDEGLKVTTESISYDLDEFSNNHGISETQWKYKATDETQWHEGQLTQMEQGKTYMIQLKVKDHQNTWSYPVTKYVTTDKSALPVAMFNLESDQLSKYEDIKVTDTSYDPVGRSITNYKWEVYSVNDAKSPIWSETTTSNTPSKTNFLENGEGQYIMYLTVTNEDSQESERFGRIFEITDDTIAPEVEANPMTCEWKQTENVKLSFSDRGGSEFKNYKYVLTNSQNDEEDDWGSATTSSKNPDSITITEEGQKYLHIKAYDNANNEGKRTVGPYKIDHTEPTVQIAGNLQTHAIDSLQLTFNSSDPLSGIKEVRFNGDKLDGTTTTTKTITRNGTYQLDVEDNAGNIHHEQIEISNIYKNCTAGLEHPEYSVNLDSCPICDLIKDLNVDKSSENVTYNAGEQHIKYSLSTGAQIVEYYNGKKEIPRNAGSYSYELKVVYNGVEYKTGKSGTLNIAKKQISIENIVPESRAYNGTTVINLSGGNLVGVEEADISNVNFVLPSTGTAKSKDIGEHEVTIPEITLTGEKANNYSLTQPTPEDVKVAISAKVITIENIEAVTREYDGTNIVQLRGGNLVGVEAIDAEKVGFVLPETGTVGSKNVGRRYVMIPVITLTGNEAKNYTLTQPKTSSVTAEITKKKTTPDGGVRVEEIIAISREYDGTNIVEVKGGKLLGIEECDKGKVNFILPQTGTTPSKDVGEYNVTIPQIELGGVESGNYELTQPKEEDITVTISKRKVNLEYVKGKDRKYNGTNVVEIESGKLKNTIEGEDVSAIIPQEGISKSVHTGTWEVQIDELTLSGEDMANYELTQPDPENVTVNILRANQPELHIESYISKINNEKLKNTIPMASIGDQKVDYAKEKNQEPIRYADKITISIRIYNEGIGSGYAQLITNKIPKGLQFIKDDETNKKYEWEQKSDDTITTKYLNFDSGVENEISAIGEKEIDYREVSFVVEVTQKEKLKDELKNITTIASVDCENLDAIENVYEEKLPVVSAAIAESGWKNSDKSVTIIALDETEKGIEGYAITKKDKKPKEWVDCTETTWTSEPIYEEGTYYAWVKDKAGNVSKSRKFEVNKIDKESPVITDFIKNGLTLTGSAKDEKSGISEYQFSTKEVNAQSGKWKTIYNPQPGEITKSENVAKYQEYKFYVKDQAGNVSESYYSIKTDSGSTTSGNRGKDTNGDGKPDVWDTNGDGKPDSWDTDGDGNADSYDKNGNGQLDDDENNSKHPELNGRDENGGRDTNRDGKPDAWDTNNDGKDDAWDTDGDGKPDSWDTDGDGNADSYDKNGNGQLDDDESNLKPGDSRDKNGGKDTNGDGKPDSWDTDGDGKDDAWDTDVPPDGNADSYDKDGDGELDDEEDNSKHPELNGRDENGGRDTNGDGKPDSWDKDGDGKDDAWDTDGDGKEDAWDTDEPKDGNADSFDKNGNGKLDDDEDNSKHPELNGRDENGGRDTNGDGKPDAWDKDGDGKDDAWDTDGDGKEDAWDTDEPKDGNADSFDKNGNGKLDDDEDNSKHPELNGRDENGGKDTNGDGKPDSWDTDGDGKDDAWDTDVPPDGNADSYDKDGDGELDDDENNSKNSELNGRDENGGRDTNGDGKPDSWDTDGDNKDDAWDTDGDGKPDSWDTDEPKDGNADSYDKNGNGQLDDEEDNSKHPELNGRDENGGRDTNGDGKPDAWDTDGDNKDDAWDTDGDGKPDSWDTDGDGNADSYDENKNGKLDPNEDNRINGGNGRDENGGHDTNGDGKPDAWDKDGDGKDDAWDTDGDGKEDAWDTDEPKDGNADSFDKNGNGKLDDDEDNSKHPELNGRDENGGRDTNGDGKPDSWDTDGDNKDDAWDTDVPPDGNADSYDKDGDGELDDEEDNSKHPELNGRDENGGRDTNGDGKPDAWDKNGDGKDDAWDTDGDGKEDAWDTDVPPDGNADSFDENGNGELDPEENNGPKRGNGRDENNGEDTNEDGKPDSWDTDGDGKNDSWDTDGDGNADSYDKNDNGQLDDDENNSIHPELNGRDENGERDTNKDGKPDAWDTNGDNKDDAWDTDGDGKPDSWDTDVPPDGNADSFDKNGNGKLDPEEDNSKNPELGGRDENNGRDTNGDGKPDSWDKNGDGKDDAWDTDGDGKEDAWDTDVPPDGNADSFDTNGNGKLDPEEDNSIHPELNGRDKNGGKDTNGDGKPDSWDTDGDGKDDAWDTDVPPDGKADSYDKDGDGELDDEEDNSKHPELNGRDENGGRDTNGDGKPDAWDTNGDNKDDTWDIDGDGKPDSWDTDVPPDGNADSYDKDGDGELDDEEDNSKHPELNGRDENGGRDTNGDGRPDAWDTNGDNKDDTWDIDGDGKPDSWDTDVPPDGNADSYDKNKNGELDPEEDNSKNGNVQNNMNSEKEVTATFKYYDIATQSEKTEVVEGVILDGEATTTIDAPDVDAITSQIYGQDVSFTPKGWSLSPEVDAEIDVQLGNEITIGRTDGTKTYYMTYEHSIKYKLYTINSVNGQVESETKNINVYLNSAGEKKGDNQKIVLPEVGAPNGWTYNGWTKGNDDPNVNLVNTQNEIPTPNTITSYHASYKKDITVERYIYKNQKQPDLTEDIYKNDIKTINAKFKLGEIPSIQITEDGEGKPLGRTITAEPRGWSTSSSVNGNVDVASNADLEIEIGENATYYASYNYGNEYTFVGYDGNEITGTSGTNVDYLGNLTSTDPSQDQFPSLPFGPAGWSANGWVKGTDPAGDVIDTKSTKPESGVEYYATYKKQVTVDRYVYSNTKLEQLTGTAYKNYVKETPASINLQSTGNASVTQDGNGDSLNEPIEATPRFWADSQQADVADTTSGNSDDTTNESTVSLNGTAHLLENKTYYMSYSFNMQVEYNDGESDLQTEQKNVKVSYNGSTSGDEFDLSNPSAPTSWNGEWTFEKWTKGAENPNDGAANKAKFNPETKYYASFKKNITVERYIYNSQKLQDLTGTVYKNYVKEATALINLQSTGNASVTQDGNGDTLNVPINATPKFWADSQQANVEDTTANNSDSTTNESTVSLNGTAHLLENKTYYMLYSFDMQVQYNNGESDLQTQKTVKLSYDGKTADDDFDLASPSAPSSWGGGWSFEKWTKDADNPNAEAANKAKFNPEIKYYASFKKEITVERYIYKNQKQPDLTGTVYKNSVTEIKPKFKLGEIASIEITEDGEGKSLGRTVTAQARGWSATPSVSGDVDVASSADLETEINENKAYYASYNYRNEYTFIKHDGNRITESSEINVDYLGNLTPTDPSKDKFPDLPAGPEGWTANGWVKGTDPAGDVIDTGSTKPESGVEYYATYKKQLTADRYVYSNTKIDQLTGTAYKNYVKETPASINLQSTENASVTQDGNGDPLNEPINATPKFWADSQQANVADTTANNSDSTINETTVSPNGTAHLLENKTYYMLYSFDMQVQYNNGESDLQTQKTVKLSYSGSTSGDEFDLGNPSAPTGWGDGWTFEKWTKDATNPKADAANKAKFNPETKYYASFKKQITITFDKNTGDTLEASPIVDYIYKNVNASTKANITMPSVGLPTKAGHEFKGWSKSAQANTAEYLTGQSYDFETSQILYAVWKEIDVTPPTIEFVPNGANDWAESHQTRVNVTDNEGLGGDGSLKFLWTTQSSEPDEQDFSAPFSTGDLLDIDEETGVYYLWVLAIDINGNKIIQRSNAFNLDNEGPNISSASSDTQVTIDQGGVKITGVATDQHSGITAYKFAQESDLENDEASWQSLSNATTDQVTQSQYVTNAGDWYFYVKDALGHVSKRNITVQTSSFSNIKPTINVSLNKNDGITADWGISADVTITYPAIAGLTKNYTRSDSNNGAEQTASRNEETFNVTENNTTITAKSTLGNNEVSADNVTIKNIDHEGPSFEGEVKDDNKLYVTFNDNASGVSKYRMSFDRLEMANGGYLSYDPHDYWATFGSGVTVAGMTSPILENVWGIGTIKIEGYDNAGNYGVSEIRISHIDDSPPEIDVVNGGATYIGPNHTCPNCQEDSYEFEMVVNYEDIGSGAPRIAAGTCANITDTNSGVIGHIVYEEVVAQNALSGSYKIKAYIHSSVGEEVLNSFLIKLTDFYGNSSEQVPFEMKMEKVNPTIEIVKDDANAAITVKVNDKDSGIRRWWVNVKGKNANNEDISLTSDYLDPMSNPGEEQSYTFNDVWMNEGTIDVVAIDRAGNIEIKNDTYTKVDNSQPILSGPDYATYIGDEDCPHCHLPSKVYSIELNWQDNESGIANYATDSYGNITNVNDQTLMGHSILESVPAVGDKSGKIKYKAYIHNSTNPTGTGQLFLKYRDKYGNESNQLTVNYDTNHY